MYNYVIKYFDDGEKVTKKICNLVCIKVMQLIYLLYKAEKPSVRPSTSQDNLSGYCMD